MDKKLRCLLLALVTARTDSEARPFAEDIGQSFDGDLPLACRIAATGTMDGKSGPLKPRTVFQRLRRMVEVLIDQGGSEFKGAVFGFATYDVRIAYEGKTYWLGSSRATPVVVGDSNSENPIGWSELPQPVLEHAALHRLAHILIDLRMERE
jgi:hypothetical protein